MLTVTKLKNNKGSKPYSVPIKVRVCAIGTRQKYQTDSGEKKDYAIVGLGDTTDVIKGVVYDSSKLSTGTLQENSSVILMNYIFKNETEPAIVITKNTKVMKTAQVNVPNSLVERAVAIANPPPAATMALKNVKTSPIKTLVSVKGRIISVSFIKMQ